MEEGFAQFLSVFGNFGRLVGIFGNRKFGAIARFLGCMPRWRVRGCVPKLNFFRKIIDVFVP